MIWKDHAELLALYLPGCTQYVLIWEPKPGMTGFRSKQTSRGLQRELHLVTQIGNTAAWAYERTPDGWREVEAESKRMQRKQRILRARLHR